MHTGKDHPRQTGAIDKPAKPSIDDVKRPGRHFAINYVTLCIQSVDQIHPKTNGKAPTQGHLPLKYVFQLSVDF